MTTVQCIEDSLQHIGEEEDHLRYEIKFQNKAVESLFNTTEVDKCLHMPSLLIKNNLSTLHEVTKNTLLDLSRQDVRILDREDHISMR